MEKELLEIRQKQNQLFSRMAQIMANFSAPVRIRLIHFLSQAPLTVEVLSQKSGESIANTSMHLRKMLNEKILQVETLGQKRLYSLHPSLFHFWEECQNFVQQIDPGIRLTDETSEDLNWMGETEETLKMLQKGDALLLDLRPLDEIEEPVIEDEKYYQHLDINDLKKEIKNLPKRKKILVLCRGRMCGLSIFATRYLRENNLKAFRLQESWFSLREKLNKRDSA
ncbi:MAG: ArsR/SmtB family transcription factor [Bacteriovoracia bacterium]